VVVPSGLFSLLDDVAAFAKLAASSIDDVGVAAARASVKAAGVVVDDTAVTPAYVRGLAADRELPIIRRLAWGSLCNKVLFILPAALVLSVVLPVAVEIILVAGGVFLAYEGAHKMLHLRHGDHHGTGPVVSEEEVVRSALRTDLILSAEIMVIALKDVLDQGLAARALILVVVAVLVTATVYGVVALLVKGDDVGLALSARSGRVLAPVGRGLVRAMPKVISVLGFVGMVAMLWVGGHIVIAGVDALGWSGPVDLLHAVADPVSAVPAVGGALGWLVDTLMSAVVGLVVGLVVVGVVALVRRATAPQR
jgi:predicted DNA repair protein MutK